VGAIAAHGMAGVWGTLALGFLTVPSLAERLGTGTGGLLYTGSASQLGTQALGLLAVGVFTFGASFLVLWAMKATFGIRTDAEAESAGLDVSEHGMWGYPEMFTPVPGGYGTDGAHPVGASWRPTPVPEAG
jgi:Amt family ammonium transporter